MNRTVALALVFAMLCVIPTFAGCGEGGDVNGATKLIESGNAQWKAFSDQFAELADQVEKFFTAYSNGSDNKPVEVEARMREFEAELQSVMDKVAKAKEPYSKVMAMTGVKHYKEYARLRLDMLKQIEKAAPVVDKAFPLIDKAVQSGKTADVNFMESSKRALIGVEMEQSFVEAQANQLAQDNRLKLK